MKTLTTEHKALYIHRVFFLFFHSSLELCFQCFVVACMKKTINLSITFVSDNSKLIAYLSPCALFFCISQMGESGTGGNLNLPSRRRLFEVGVSHSASLTRMHLWRLWLWKSRHDWNYSGGRVTRRETGPIPGDLAQIWSGDPRIDITSSSLFKTSLRPLLCFRFFKILRDMFKTLYRF